MADAPRGRLLVTGGAGFIGSWFVRRWLSEARGPVWNLDKLTYAGRLESLFEAADDPAHHFVAGDVADGRLLTELIAEAKPDWVVHLAAESHVDRSIEAPADFVATNVQGAHALLDASLLYWRRLPESRRNRFRLLNVSTDEVFGSAAPDEWFTERSAFAPNSPYAATKAAAAHLARAYHRTYGLPVITSFSSNNFGPCQHPEKLIPKAILSAEAELEIPVYGDGRHERDWLHVDDHASAILTLLEKAAPGESYNVGGSGPLANRGLLEMLLDQLDRRLGRASGRGRMLLRSVADRPGHDRRYALDSRRLKTLGWRPRTPLQEGLRTTVDWYLENRKWLAEYGRDDYHKRRGLTRES